LSVNVIYWHRNLEYLTLLWSTATFNICQQYTDNCQVKLVFYNYYSTNFTVTSTYQLQNKLKKTRTSNPLCRICRKIPIISTDVQ
jgi:hypothetical protein